MEIDEPVVAAVRQYRVLPCVLVNLPPPHKWRDGLQCYERRGPNHIAMHCRKPRKGRGHSQRYAATSARKKDMLPQGVQEMSTILSPHRLKEVLPVIKVQIDRIDRTALVDSGCSSSIVSGLIWQRKRQKRTTILMAGRKCHFSHGVGSITLKVTNRNPLETDMLVVNSKPLGFDLLLGMGIIK